MSEATRPSKPTCSASTRLPSNVRGNAPGAFPADFNSFEIPTLYGISKTAPYFHDNSAATLRDVIKLYQLGFIAVRRVVPESVPPPVRPDELPDELVPALLAYLGRI